MAALSTDGPWPDLHHKVGRARRPRGRAASPVFPARARGNPPAPLPRSARVSAQMSKKIAQLTKVIYHLNTMNEDHQTELASAKKAHRRELDEALADAGAKLRDFQERLASKKAAEAAAGALEALQAKHDAEKAAALGEFAQFKADARKREKAAADDAQRKLCTLRDEVSDVRLKFKAARERFDATAAALASELGDKAGAGADELARARAEHEAALAECVRQGNAK